MTYDPLQNPVVEAPAQNASLLSEISRLCSRELPEEALRKLVHLLQERGFPVSGLLVDSFSEETKSIRFFARADAKKGEKMDAEVALPEKFARSLDYTERPDLLIVKRIDEDPVTAYATRSIVPGIESFVMLRLALDGRHVGVICFYSLKENAFTEAEAEVIASLTLPLSYWVAQVWANRLSLENESLRRQLKNEKNEPLERFLSASPGLLAVAQKMKRIADTPVTVLIEGESGTGKEVTARTLVQMSSRRNAPFIAVNCGAIPASLLESELFGYEKGAFTDATGRHVGYFEQAQGGTLFLDEIEELSALAQVKLLRVLQERTITRVGGERAIPVDVRIIAATNRSLEEMIESGLFREDLYYRLMVFPIKLPPLRERPGDIGLLARFFLKRIAAKYQLPEIPKLTPEALEEAVRYRWPGNVRELENSTERAALEEGAVITHLVKRRARFTNKSTEKSLPEGTEEKLNLADYSWEALQKAYFSALLESCSGKISGPGGVAARAKMHPNTLRSRLEKLGLL